MKEKTVKKRKLKRLLSVVLSLVMVITLIQVNRMTVYAWDVSNTKLSDFVYEGTNISSLRVQFDLPSAASKWTTCYCYVGVQCSKFDTTGDLKNYTMGKHEVSKEALLSNDSEGSLKTIYGIKALSVTGFNAFGKDYMQVDAAVQLPENTCLEAGQDYYFYLWTTRTASEACDEYWSCPHAFTDTDIYPDAYLGKMTIKTSGAVVYEDSKGDVKEYAEHSWEYTANADGIAAKCLGSQNGCTYENCGHDTEATALKLTLSAISPTYSDGTTGWDYGQTVGFSLTGKDAWEAAELTTPTIKYVGKAPTSYGESENAPTEAGTYTAKITVGDKTATQDFVIVAPHTHSYAEGWSKDATYHWHAATCEHTSEVSGKEAHSYGTAGDARFTCSVCKYVDSDKKVAAELADKLKADKEAVNAVVEKINAIGTVTYTEACKIKIDAARTAYDELTTEQKEKVTREQLQILKDAETEYVRLKTSEGKYESVKPETGSVIDITGSTEAPTETNPFSAAIKNATELETLVNVTAEEKAQGVNVWLEIVDASATMPAEDKEKINSVVEDYTVGAFLDASVFKKVGNEDATRVANLNGNIKISFVVPEELRKDGRIYEMIRVHEGVPTVITGTYDAETYTFTFETNQFSSYALAYKDATTIENPNNTTNTETSKPSAPQTGDVNDNWFWFIVMFLGMGTIGIMMLYRRKNEI